MCVTFYTTVGKVRPYTIITILGKPDSLTNTNNSKCYIAFPMSQQDKGILLHVFVLLWYILQRNIKLAGKVLLIANDPWKLKV